MSLITIAPFGAHLPNLQIKVPNSGRDGKIPRQMPAHRQFDYICFVAEPPQGRVAPTVQFEGYQLLKGHDLKLIAGNSRFGERNFAARFTTRPAGRRSITAPLRLSSTRSATPRTAASGHERLAVRISAASCTSITTRSTSMVTRGYPCFLHGESAHDQMRQQMIGQRARRGPSGAQETAGASRLAEHVPSSYIIALSWHASHDIAKTRRRKKKELNKISYGHSFRPTLTVFQKRILAAAPQIEPARRRLHASGIAAN